MTQQPPPTPAAAGGVPPGPDRLRAMQITVLGAVLAVLGPLGGFLTGSMIGPSQTLGDYDAMFVAMFLGLLVGGVGTLVAGVGVMRLIRRDPGSTAG